jgi:hypothetical protein
MLLYCTNLAAVAFSGKRWPNMTRTRPVSSTSPWSQLAVASSAPGWGTKSDKSITGFAQKIPARETQFSTVNL